MSDEPIRVHPAAAVFPMLSDDELADLAADIKANGLLHPIVMDRDGQLVDGRNRYAACLLANVDPDYVVLEHGVDPVAFILSQNIHRRHLSKGQQAMALAKMLDLEGGRTGARALTFPGKVSEARISYAATVLRYAPDLVENVLSGAMQLNAAYEDARSRKDAASSMEAQLGRLRAEAPDLAELVVEERISLREALAIQDRRAVDERKRREAATAGLLSSVRFLAPPAGSIDGHADNLLAAFDPALVPGAEGITPEVLNRAITFLELVRRGLDLARG